MTQERSSELDLWDRARRGDGRAYAALFDLHRARVFQRALGLLANSQDAEDVTSSAFFELWRKRRSVRVVDGSVLPWLLVTAVNLGRNVRRSRGRYEQILKALHRGDEYTRIDENAVDAARRLSETLRQVGGADAALFVLVALEEIPLGQAAEAVGLTEPAARMRLHRMRRRLRVELHDLHPLAD